MQALDVLTAEHRHIVRVLDATEQAVVRARAQQAADPRFFKKLSHFIEHFADGAHHAKEEEVLFRALEDFGLPIEGGPLHTMLAEHALGRDLRNELIGSATAFAQGQRAALFDVLDTAARYSALLRSHIHKEDMVLYPMAEQLLPAEVFATMLGRYGEVTQVTAADFGRAADELTHWTFADQEARV